MSVGQCQNCGYLAAEIGGLEQADGPGRLIHYRCPECGEADDSQGWMMLDDDCPWLCSHCGLASPRVADQSRKQHNCYERMAHEYQHHLVCPACEFVHPGVTHLRTFVCRECNTPMVPDYVHEHEVFDA